MFLSHFDEVEYSRCHVSSSRFYVFHVSSIETFVEQIRSQFVYNYIKHGKDVIKVPCIYLYVPSTTSTTTLVTHSLRRDVHQASISFCHQSKSRR